MVTTPRWVKWFEPMWPTPWMVPMFGVILVSLVLALALTGCCGEDEKKSDHKDQSTPEVVSYVWPGLDN